MSVFLASDGHWHNPAGIEQCVRVTMTGDVIRPVAQIPFYALKRTSFSKLVAAGGHQPCSKQSAMRLKRELKTERAIILGAGHSVPHTGAPFNERLEAPMKSA
jgi:hypothetical protein